MKDLWIICSLLIERHNYLKNKNPEMGQYGQDVVIAVSLDALSNWFEANRWNIYGENK